MGVMGVARNPYLCSGGGTCRSHAGRVRERGRLPEIFTKPKNDRTMKTSVREVYRCSTCGGVVEVLGHGAVMQCCGQPMTLLEGNTTDASMEKHVPVVEAVDGGFLVRVGGARHPMEPGHYIQWVELVTPSQVLRREPKPGGEPEALFRTDEKPVCARAYCNLHGLWKG